MFKAAVDGLGGSVTGAVPVEERQDIGGPMLQGLAEPADLRQGLLSISQSYFVSFKWEVVPACPELS